MKRFKKLFLVVLTTLLVVFFLGNNKAFAKVGPVPIFKGSDEYPCVRTTSYQNLLFDDERLHSTVRSVVKDSDGTREDVTRDYLFLSANEILNTDSYYSLTHEKHHDADGLIIKEYNKFYIRLGAHNIYKDYQKLISEENGKKKYLKLDLTNALDTMTFHSNFKCDWMNRLDYYYMSEGETIVNMSEDELRIFSFDVTVSFYFTIDTLNSNGDVVATSEKYKVIMDLFVCEPFWKVTGTTAKGYYAVTEPISRDEKVYVPYNFVCFIKALGKDVYRENNKYYYYANKNEGKIVSIKEISNDIDSLIFMVKELEKKAIEFDKPDFKNHVLGYIRSINRDYDSEKEMKYKMVAGETNTGFIGKVNSDSTHGLKFNEYFGSFIGYNLYNDSVYGKISEMSRKAELRLIDPVDNVSNIDLIHMFASMDGIYESTKNYVNLGRNNQQRDIVSWHGDLQQAIASLQKKGSYLIEYLTHYAVFAEDNGASKDDIIADIDAMNITKMYIDEVYYTISTALLEYYNSLKENKHKRYSMFIDSVINESEMELDGDDKLEKFETEVYGQFNLKKEKDGKIVDYEYYRTDYVGFTFMNEPIYPNKQLRQFVAAAFIEFIEENLED